MERIDELNVEGLRVIQNTDYFLYGVDSVLLANMVEVKSNDVVVDLCTGSFVIPTLILAKQQLQKIIGVEIQKEMYDLAVKNILMNKQQSRAICMLASISDTKNIRKTIRENTTKELADIVVCNPPYKEVGTGIKNSHTVKYNARYESLCNLNMVFESGASILRSRGKMYLVHKAERINDCINIARKYNLEAKYITFLHKDIYTKASLVFIQYVKDGGVECKVLAPIIQNNIDGEIDNEGKNNK